MVKTTEHTAEQKRRRSQSVKAHHWTIRKLERIASYLPPFTQMVNRAYRTIYMDAFAGSGRIESLARKKTRRRVLFRLPEVCTDGSARRSLQVTPPFERYFFVDKDKSRCVLLGALRRSFPSLSDRIRIQCGDANRSIVEFCDKIDWMQWRAVLFLDPFGLQVDWSTIEAVARTHAIDMWYWFPLGIGLNRLLPRKGHISEAKSVRLDRVLGSHAWHHAFYRTHTRQHFFGKDIKTVKIASFRTLSRYFVEQLEAVFPYVSQKPLWFYNCRGNPMYLLYFATADPDAEKRFTIAQKILSIPSTAADFSSRFDMLLSGETAT